MALRREQVHRAMRKADLRPTRPTPKEANEYPGGGRRDNGGHSVEPWRVSALSPSRIGSKETSRFISLEGRTVRKRSSASHDRAANRANRADSDPIPGSRFGRGKATTGTTGPGGLTSADPASRAGERGRSFSAREPAPRARMTPRVTAAPSRHGVGARVGSTRTWTCSTAALAAMGSIRVVTVPNAGATRCLADSGIVASSAVTPT